MGAPPGEQTTTACEPALRAAEAAIERLAAIPIDQLDGQELQGLLSRIRRPLLQLEAVRSRAAAASLATAVSQSERTPAGAVIQDHQRRLAEDQQVTHSEAKQQVAAGRAARDHEATGRAMTDGRIAPRHAQLIAGILAETPMEQRAEVEQELLALAIRLDATGFGRAARELLGRVRPQALAKDESRQHRARALRATTTEDGGFAFSGLLYGAAAEQARTALNAFRRPDTPDEARSPAQRAADAFEQLCASALRVGEAPTRHGRRPQVMVVFSADQYAALSAAPELATGRFLGSGLTATGSEVRNLVDDCELFRVVLDARGVPMEVSTEVRTVPVGLWRALLVRDGGCVWQGCDAPASWCDVAHGKRSFARGGKLSLDNSLLLCRRHHRRFDRGSYTVSIDGDRVGIERVRSAGSAAATDADLGESTQHRGGPFPAGAAVAPAGTDSDPDGDGDRSDLPPQPRGRRPASRADEDVANSPRGHPEVRAPGTDPPGPAEQGRLSLE